MGTGWSTHHGADYIIENARIICEITYFSTVNFHILTFDDSTQQCDRLIKEYLNRGEEVKARFGTPRQVFHDTYQTYLGNTS